MSEPVERSQTFGPRVQHTPCPACGGTKVREIGYGIVGRSIEWAVKTGNILRPNAIGEEWGNLHCDSCGLEYRRPLI